MNGAPLPIAYLPLVWAGVVGTSLTYAALARARIDLAHELAPLNVRNPSTLAICVYNMWTLAGAASLWFLLGRRGIPAAAVGLSGSLSLAGAALAVAGAAAGIALWPAIKSAMGFVEAKRLRARLLVHPQSNRLSMVEIVLLTAFGVIVGPALEEFIFRGYVLGALRGYALGASGALLCASAIFASIHFAFGVGLVAYAFCLSLLLSALFLLSDNLYPAILMHSLINLWGLVAAPLLFPPPRPEHP